MNFKDLAKAIQGIHTLFENKANQSINTCVTIRNWLFGYYVQEYELKGRDRGQYGEKLIERLAEELQQKKVPSASDRSLTLYKQFYQEYPIIGQIAFPRLKELSPVKKPQLKIPQTPSAESLLTTKIPQLPPESLISSLSFSHFVELMKIDDPLKRSFYEFEGIRGSWSTRDLKRQIGSLYYERTALSKDKKKLREHMSKEISQQNIGDIIRDPYVFEFLGLKPTEALYESELANGLLDKLQEFLLELGKGFCFEAKNKRILIGNDYFFVDLVMYHRVLKW